MPFAVADFFDVFRRYNEAVWPAQVVLTALAVVTVLLAARSTPRSSAAASLILAALWVWMGLVYHLGFFTRINPLAIAFFVGFVAQAVLIIAYGVWRRRIELRFDRSGASVLAGVVLAYALLGYPALGYALGHQYPAAPTFGVPCPTTIFTFGILLLAGRSLPRVLLIIPTLWALVATSAALSLGVPEDFGLPIAALMTVAISIARGHGVPREEPQVTSRVLGGAT